MNPSTPDTVMKQQARLKLARKNTGGRLDEGQNKRPCSANATILLD